MTTTVREPEGGTFAVAPEGVYQAVCADIWDIWTEKRPEQWGGGLVDKTRIIWQLDVSDEESGRPYEVAQVYTASLHEKAKLRQHLESWRGRKFTAEELKGFDLENVIGANCQIQVVHNLGSNGKTYANVAAIMPLGKTMTKFRVSDGYVRHRDRTKTNGTPAQQYEAPEEVPF